ncbi:MAG: hypothetical protein MZV63_61235 [Marinilabiliales bacterium]|nr:hypothetical protein [Marinilabiliales bacterium]
MTVHKLVGPSFAGLYGSQRTVNEDSTQKTVTADEAYIISSIYDPNKEIVDGYARNLMQSYRELLTAEQIAVMTEYLKTLSTGWQLRGSTVAMVAELTKWKLSLAVAFSAVTGYLIFCRRCSAAGTVCWWPPESFFCQQALLLSTSTPRERVMPSWAGLQADRCLRADESADGCPEWQFCCLFPVAILLGFSGLLPVMLGLVNVLLYNVVYTGLKKGQLFAIIPGALVGAVPPAYRLYSCRRRGDRHRYHPLCPLHVPLADAPLLAAAGHDTESEYEKAGIRTVYSSMNSDQIRQPCDGSGSSGHRCCSGS